MVRARVNSCGHTKPRNELSDGGGKISWKENKDEKNDSLGKSGSVFNCLGNSDDDGLSLLNKLIHSLKYSFITSY